MGVVTQSGGTGSYIHNLAAARGSGLAISVSTGNEIDIKLGEAIEGVSGLDEVEVVLALIETVRDGQVFIESVRAALALGKPVVACRSAPGARKETDDHPYRSHGRAREGSGRRPPTRWAW